MYILTRTINRLYSERYTEVNARAPTAHGHSLPELAGFSTRLPSGCCTTIIVVVDGWTTTPPPAEPPPPPPLLLLLSFNTTAAAGADDVTISGLTPRDWLAAAAGGVCEAVVTVVTVVGVLLLLTVANWQASGNTTILDG